MQTFIYYIQGVMGKGLKSHEKMAVSPNGLKIAFAGIGGYVHIICGKQRIWLMDIKMNCAVRALAFIDDSTLVSSGLDADVYVWDLRFTGRCIGR
jgi:WD40 repeat protein